MAIPHATPGEVVDVRPYGPELPSQSTRTLVKTDRLEIIRLVLPAGKELAPHRAPGVLVVHCLEGQATFSALGGDHELTAGTLLYLDANEPHAVKAVEATSLLLTLMFEK
jgi:quercetin dioxygenase-like cupin family protein